MKQIPSERFTSAKKQDADPKRTMSEKIADQTAAFLASGNEITEVDKGVSGYRSKEYGKGFTISKNRSEN